MLARVNNFDPDDLSGVYATPPAEIGMADVHPRLVEDVVARSEMAFAFYHCAFFEIPSAAPWGELQIAADAIGGTACAVYREFGNPLHDPIWLEYDGDVQQALNRVCDHLRAEGALP